mmetsp:Transcript_76131/g.164737  ORF Transcript_76131/g.164737 Transcript_76131/m.164737 type:complete len:94 (+) Transcript_76131:599-880(+)
MAPEQLMKKPYLTFQCDLYSIGAIIYEIKFHSIPYEFNPRMNENEKKNIIISSRILKPKSEILDNVNKNLTDFIWKLLQNKESNRSTVQTLMK